jgi:hypothetical protein
LEAALQIAELEGAMAKKKQAAREIEAPMVGSADKSDENELDVLKPFEAAFLDFGWSLHRVAGAVYASYGEAYREYVTDLQAARGDPARQHEAYRRFVERVSSAWHEAKQATLGEFHKHVNAVNALWAEVDSSRVSPEALAAVAANLHNAGYWTRAAEYNLWLAFTGLLGGQISLSY